MGGNGCSTIHMRHSLSHAIDVGSMIKDGGYEEDEVWWKLQAEITMNRGGGNNNYNEGAYK